MKYRKEYIDVLLFACLELKKDDRLVLLLPSGWPEIESQIEASAKAIGVSDIHIIREQIQQEFIHYQTGHTEKFTWITEEDYKLLDRACSEHGKLLILRSTPFGLYSKLSPEQQRLRAQHYNEDFLRIYYYIQANLIPYCLGVLPNAWWAGKMFPQMEQQQAVELLWEKLHRAIYLDRSDPVEAWRQRASELSRRAALLNGKAYEAIRVEGPGTDLTLELHPSHVWQGGYLMGPGNVRYIPNLPTEEVFTTPSKAGVHGCITIRHLFYFGGKLIDHYKLLFENGVCTGVESDHSDFNEKFMGYLRHVKNGTYLGEIALVSNDAGAKQANTYFYDMVYDENSSCHFAFGNSYRSSIARGEEMSDERFAACGANISQLHMDFMYDSENMMIYGIKAGEKELILDHGQWRLTGESEII